MTPAKILSLCPRADRPPPIPSEPLARPTQRVARQLQDAFDIEPAECLHVSAKTGRLGSHGGMAGGPWLECQQHAAPALPASPFPDALTHLARFQNFIFPNPAGLGLEAVLPAVIERVPPPRGNPRGDLRMLLFDAYHDEYRWAGCSGGTSCLPLPLPAAWLPATAAPSFRRHTAPARCAAWLGLNFGGVVPPFWPRSGVVCLVEVIDGLVQKGDRITAAATGEGAGPISSPASCRLAPARTQTPIPPHRRRSCPHSPQPLLLAVPSFLLLGLHYDVAEVGLLAPEPHATGQLLTGQVRRGERPCCRGPAAQSPSGRHGSQLEAWKQGPWAARRASPAVPTQPPPTPPLTRQHTRCSPSGGLHAGGHEGHSLRSSGRHLAPAPPPGAAAAGLQACQEHGFRRWARGGGRALLRGNWLCRHIADREMGRSAAPHPHVVATNRCSPRCALLQASSPCRQRGLSTCRGLWSG